FRAGKARFRQAGTRLEPARADDGFPILAARADDGFPILVTVQSTPPEWHHMEREEVLAAPGLEYATTYAFNTDRSRLYAVEPHLSSLSVHAVGPNLNPVTWPRTPVLGSTTPGPEALGLHLIDRIAEGQKRLRTSELGGATPGPEALGFHLIERISDGQKRLRYRALPSIALSDGYTRTLATKQVCALDAFTLAATPHLLISSGCQLLTSNTDFPPEHEPCGTP
ncbi:hypothetical protein T484DRAFT_1866673, partial [Baffinella frigidus]